MKKSFLAMAALVVGLVGCSSGVKLSDTPVEDRAPSAPVAGASSGIGAGQATGSVTSVSTERATAGQGPVGTPHVVYFDYDSFVIRTEAKPVIEAHARFLQTNKQRKASLEGHTDERGGREYNLALGQKRAEAVQRALVLLGVPESQIESVSYGKEKPAIEGTGEEAWAKNRRVEFKY